MNNPKGVNALEYLENGFMKNMNDVRASLLGTHRIVRASISRCDAEAREEYFHRTGRRAHVEHEDTALKEGMIEDLNIQANQILTGRDGNKRGAHHKGAYNGKFVEPMYIQKFFQPTNSRSSSTITELQKFQISEALSGLSWQELNCYQTVRGLCATVDETARAFCISSRNVRKCLKRADKKIKKALEENWLLQKVVWDYAEETE